jgi:pyruvate/2-oxoglutarate/acetoin dehydrogenase E1 component
MTYGSAIRETLKEEMKKNPNIVIIGEDVGKFGGAFKVTLGLLDEFGPNRVIDTPISESAIVGVALGAALMGMRPVAEIMYMDFLQLSMQQLVTQAARARYLSGGKLSVPLVVRTQYSLGRTYGPQHSQFFPSWFSQAPGLKVVAPSTPADASGLLKDALAENNPVLFIECGTLYTITGKISDENRGVKIGEADVKRSGRDVTIVAISRVLNEALEAAELLVGSGIEAEVIDPRTLQPLDTNTLVDSVKKTGRLLIASDDFPVGGIGATIESAILEDVFYHLKAPIEIIGSPNFPVPSNVVLEKEYMIDRKDIAEAAKSLVTEN